MMPSWPHSLRVTFSKTGFAVILIAVSEEVLHECGCLPVSLVVALQPLHKSDNHRAIEIGIFSIAFFSSAPTRIATQISIRRANNDSALMVFATLKDVPRFVTFNRSRLPQNIRIPRFAKADALRKRRGRNRRRASPFAGSALR